MRTLKTTLTVVCTFLVLPLCLLQAQDKYWVHEDVVKPSMVAEYETVCKDLTSNLKKHNIQGLNIIVTNTSDNRYLWVSPVNSIADVERPVFKALAEKMGEDKMGALFDRMDKCYDIEQNYLISLDKELSYMPDGITQTPAGEDYRKFHYYHYTPGNRSVVLEKVKAIKSLFESKGAKMHYRVYRSGFGTRGEFYMVAIAAGDAADYATKIEENNQMMGEDWQKTYGEFMESLEKYEVFEGRMRPDMAYSPSN